MILGRRLAARNRAFWHRRSGRAGEVGEVVITSFNRNYPLVRLAPASFRRARGLQLLRAHQYAHQGLDGRADQTTKVRGMFVTPKQVRRNRAPASADRKGALGGRRHNRGRQYDVRCEPGTRTPG